MTIIITNNNWFQTQDWSDSGGGGLRYLEMLFRCNYLAMVGTGQNPRLLPQKPKKSCTELTHQVSGEQGLRLGRS